MANNVYVTNSTAPLLSAFSLTIRARLSNSRGELDRFASAVGAAGGGVVSTETVESDATTNTHDVVIFCASEGGATAVASAARHVSGVDIVTVSDRTFQLHEGGKLRIEGQAPLNTKDDLAMTYTPGVARVCSAIATTPDLVHRYTMKANTVAVVTDGTAVLGLGNIGPQAALPVMEGKAALFRSFADVDAVPLCLDVHGVDDFVETVKRLEPVFGGINLEDIAAPQCFEVEERLAEALSIPVLHDDQHGTAVVVLAALRNAMRVTGRSLAKQRIVLSGAGAAGVAIAKILTGAGVDDIVVADRHGGLHKGRIGHLAPSKRWLVEHTNPEGRRGTLV